MLISDCLGCVTTLKHALFSRIDEGYRRIITYNSDCVVNGVVVMKSSMCEQDQDIEEEQHRLLDNAEF